MLKGELVAMLNAVEDDCEVKVVVHDRPKGWWSRWRNRNNPHKVIGALFPVRSVTSRTISGLLGVKKSIVIELG